MKKYHQKAAELVKMACACSIFALGLSVGSAQAASVSLGWAGPSSGSVTVGETFSVGLTFSGLSGAAGDSVGFYDFGLKYDTSAFQLVGSVFGTGSYNPLDLPGGKYEFIGEITDSAGQVSVLAISGSTQSEIDALQPHSFTALTLQFVALAVNPLAAIEFDLNSPFLIGASDGTDVTLATQLPQLLLSVNAAGAGAVPEPGMAYLLGLGLLGVWAGRRRQFDALQGKKEQ